MRRSRIGLWAVFLVAFAPAVQALDFVSRASRRFSDQSEHCPGGGHRAPDCLRRAGRFRRGLAAGCLRHCGKRRGRGARHRRSAPRPPGEHRALQQRPGLAGGHEPARRVRRALQHAGRGNALLPGEALRGRGNADQGRDRHRERGQRGPTFDRPGCRRRFRRLLVEQERGVRRALRPRREAPRIAARREPGTPTLGPDGRRRARRQLRSRLAYFRRFAGRQGRDRRAALRSLREPGGPADRGASRPLRGELRRGGRDGRWRLRPRLEQLRKRSEALPGPGPPL